MNDTISRQQAIDALGEKPYGYTDYDIGLRHQWGWDVEAIQKLPSAEPQIIQKFCDYQIEWLQSHHDITFDHDTEELIIQFLIDTADSYMKEGDV